MGLNCQGQQNTQVQQGLTPEIEKSGNKEVAGEALLFLARIFFRVASFRAAGFTCLCRFTAANLFTV